jgi:hypothetical protein
MEYSFDQIQSILARKHTLPSETENSLMDLRVFIMTKTYPEEVRNEIEKYMVFIQYSFFFFVEKRYHMETFITGDSSIFGLLYLTGATWSKLYGCQNQE